MARPNPPPTFEEAMKVELDELAWMVSSADLLFFGKLRIPEPASLHQGLWKAKRIPALLSCPLVLLCLCVHHRHV
jgi:hypothetical protein